MSEKISRRNFLRTATLGAAAAGLLAGCGSASSSAAFFSFRPDSQPFKLRTICRIDCMRELAALMSRFRLPMLVCMPFFSNWLTAGPMWTVGILSIPCRA